MLKVMRKLRDKKGIEIVEILVSIMVLGAIAVVGLQAISGGLSSKIGAEGTTTPGTLLGELDSNVNWGP